MGGSKGKRLKRFLQLVDDETALRTLRALWEYRCDFLLKTGQNDSVGNAEARHLALVDRLSGGPAPASSQERPKAAFDTARAELLKQELVTIARLEAQARG